MRSFRQPPNHTGKSNIQGILSDSLSTEKVPFLDHFDYCTENTNHTFLLHNEIVNVVSGTLDGLLSLKQVFTNVSYHMLVARLTLMALFFKLMITLDFSLTRILLVHKTKVYPQGGTLVFSSYVGSGPASTVHPQKLSGI